MASANEPENAPLPQDENQTEDAVSDKAAALAGGDETLAVEDKDPDDQETIHLPEPKSPELDASLDDEDAYRRRRAADVILAALVVVFAFLLASAAIGNSDLWLHLATGRYLAADISKLGADPFTFTAQSEQWVNHNWLFDLTSFWIYNVDAPSNAVTSGNSFAAGGRWLGLLQAALISLTALVMIRACDRRRSLWTAVICVCVGLLAMSNRFEYFQPIVVSLLFVAVTLGLLLRRPRAQDGKKSYRHLLLLPLLFILWVNLDDWFLLGPLLVGIFLIGDGIEYMTLGAAAKQEAGRRLKMQGIALVFGLLACFINPYAHNAFRLPVEVAYLAVNLNDALEPNIGFNLVPEFVAGAGVTVRDIENYDPSISRIFASSFPVRQRNVPAICHILLLVIGVLSFVAMLIAGPDEKNPSGAWSRFLVWLGFAALSVLIARLIPLFAVAGAIIAALNFQVAAPRIARDLSLPTKLVMLWRIGGRLATAAGLLGLLFLVFPGWIRGEFGSANSRYRVNWSVQPRAGLRETAVLLGDWQKAGKIKNCYNLDPAAGCYLAWYCPEVKYCFDYRFELFQKQGATLGKIRNMLMPMPSSIPARKKTKEKDLVQTQMRTFRENNVSHVVFSGAGFASLASALGQLEFMPSWRLAAPPTDHSLIYRWSASEKPTDYCLSVGAGASAYVESKNNSTGQDHPVVFPIPPDFWQRFLFAHGSKDNPEQRVLLLARGQFASNARFLSLSERQTQTTNWMARVGYIGGNFSCCQFDGAMSAILTYSQSFAFKKMFQPTRVAIDYSFALLAVRAARQAVRENPNDPAAYRALARALSNLWTLEQAYIDPNPMNRENARAYVFQYILRPNQPPMYAEDYWLQCGDPAQFSLRYNLRRAQAVTTDQHILLLQPDNFSAHLRLGRHFSRMHFFDPRTQPTGFFDIALMHVARAKSILDAKKSSDELIRFQLDRSRKIHDELAALVKARRDFYRLHAAKRPPLERFHFALYGQFAFERDGRKFVQPLGLAGEALEVLDDWKASTPQERQIATIWRLRLLVAMGRMKEAYDILQSIPSDGPLAAVKQEALLYLYAALGDYDSFEKSMAPLNELGRRGDWKRLVPYAIPAPPPPPRNLVSLARYLVEKQENQMSLVTTFQLLAGAAQQQAIRGFVALEAGDVDRAERLLQSAEELTATGLNLPELIIARDHLQQLRAAKKQK